MDPFIKTMKKAVAEIGGKKTNYKDEIYAKRRCQRKLAQEFGINVFSAYQKGKRDQVDALYEELAVRYNDINKEIHELESRYLATQKIPFGLTKFTTMLISEEKNFLDRKIVCEKCKEQIDNEVIECRLDEQESERLYFHRDCFLCAICKTQFTTASCYFLEGKSFCQSCLPKAEKNLLQWCQTNLGDFEKVEIKDFDLSFNDGFAFAALIRHFKPEHLDVKSVHLDDPIATLTAAFQGMDWSGIPVILHPSFMLETDRQSIVTQVSLIREKFESKIPHSLGKEKWNHHLVPRKSAQYCQGDEYLQGKPHVISSSDDGGKKESKTNSDSDKELTMTFDNDPTLVTGGGGGKPAGAYEIIDKTTGQRTIREPVSGSGIDD